jgi:hypothetical protein
MGALFGAKKPQAVRMPDLNSPVSREAEERKRREIAGRSGRASTRLSGRSGEAGTGAYSNSLLGSAG